MKHVRTQRELCQCEVCGQPATLILEPVERKGSREPEALPVCAYCVKVIVEDGDQPGELVQFHGGAEVSYTLIDGQVWATRRVSR